MPAGAGAVFCGVGVEVIDGHLRERLGEAVKREPADGGAFLRLADLWLTCDVAGDVGG